MVIRRSVLGAQPQAHRTPVPANSISRRRQSAIREITQTWEVSKYREKRKFVVGQRVTVFSPDMPTREFLVEFYPGLRLKISEEDLEQFTKEV